MNKETLFKPIIETAVIETMMMDSEEFKSINGAAPMIEDEDYYNQIISDCEFTIIEVSRAKGWDPEEPLDELHRLVDEAKTDAVVFDEAYSKEQVGELMQAIFETGYKTDNALTVMRMMRLGYRTLELKDLDFCRE